MSELRAPSRFENAFEFYMRKARTIDVSTARNDAVLWSGRGAREASEDFAYFHGKTTLEGSPGGYWLDQERLFPDAKNWSPLTVPEAREVWATISKRYVEGASGSMVGILRNPYHRSIFMTVEQPAALKNPNVTNIITGGQ